MAYLDTICLTKTIPCLAEPGKIIVVGTPSHPLNDVIPYLATLPGVIAYNPNYNTLTFRRPRGFMTIYTDKINITQVNDASEGLVLLEALKEAINATWEHRAELTPITGILKAPGLLEIWKLLPCTNCGECGEITCMAFAANLVQGIQQPDECSIIRTDPAFADRRSALLTLVAS